VKAVHALLFACALALAVSGSAAAKTPSDFAGHHRQVFPVYVVKGLTLGDLPQLATEGAVGVMVPNAGPRTSQAAAFAGMVRGSLYNTRLPRPRGTVLIRVRHVTEIPAHGPAIVVGLPPATSAPNDRRYPIAVLGRGYHGLLVSSLTRVPGLVSIADVARTALQTPHALETRRDGGPVATSYRLESQITVARTTTMPGSVLVLCLLVLIALFYPRGAPTALGAAIAINLVLGWFPDGAAAPRVTLLGLVTLAGALIGPMVLRRSVHLGVAMAALLAAYAASLLVPSLVAAALLAQRFGVLAFVAVGGLSLATIAENQLGADGGGAIVVGVAFALLAVGLLGARRRYTLPALGVAALIVLALVNIDAAASGPDHLRGAVHGGINGVTSIAANRVPLAYARMVEQWWLLIPGLAAAIVCVAVIRRGRARAVRAVATALLGALVASLLVNDSPGPVTIAGLAAVLSIEGGLVHRTLVLPVLRRVATPVAVPQKP
jgi:hypothetical protein